MTSSAGSIHGCDALAFALLDGGVTAAAAFPGSPSTSLATSIEGMGGMSLRWCVNENDVLCFALGRAMAGRGAVAIMKHVGVNVAKDALEAIGVIHGLPAPLLVVEGQDSRPGSSQNAQDNRPSWAGSLDMLVLAPGDAVEGYALGRSACALSRTFGMPLVLRGDARLFKDLGAPMRTPADAAVSGPAWPGRPLPLATAAATYDLHRRHRRTVLGHLAPWIEGLCERWTGAPERAGHGTGVVIAGHLGRPIASAVKREGWPGLRILVEHPLPESTLAAWLRAFPRVVVLEECLPHLQERVQALAHREKIAVEILGRAQLGDDRHAGWLEGKTLSPVLERLAALGPAAPVRTVPEARTPDLGWTASDPDRRLAQAIADGYAAHLAEHPFRGFVGGDPRRELFEVLRTLGGDRPTFVTSDPGITGLFALGGGRSDVKMHMGGAVPIAAGWSRARPEGLSIATVGDTNLFHSEWLGILESAAAGDDLLVVIVDNGCSEMTARLVPLRPSVEQSLASLGALGCRVTRCKGTRDRADPWAAVLADLARGSGVRIAWVEV